MASKHRFTSAKADGPDATLVRPSDWNADHFGELFNHTFNGDMEIWGAGAAAAPTGYTLVGAGASVAKNTTAGQFKVTAASAALTRGGNDCKLTQRIDTIPGWGPVGRWQSKSVTLGCWVRATVAGRARIAVFDGATRTFSSYHSGGSAFEFLTVTVTLGAGATEVTIELHVDTGDTTAQFDGMILCVGVVPQDFVPSGWRGRKCVFVAMSDFGGVAAATTTFLHTMGDGAETTWPVPFKGVARNLATRNSATPGGVQTYVYTLRKANADTALTATATGAQGSANDLVNEVAFAQLDAMSLKIVTSATANVSTHGATWEYEETP